MEHCTFYIQKYIDWKADHRSCSHWNDDFAFLIPNSNLIPQDDWLNDVLKFKIFNCNVQSIRQKQKSIGIWYKWEMYSEPYSQILFSAKTLYHLFFYLNLLYFNKCTSSKLRKTAFIMIMVRLHYI